MRYFLVDIGSNTVRMNAYDINLDKESKLLFSEKETLGLINYIENDVMSEEGCRKLIKLLDDFKQTAVKIGYDAFICFATAGLRNITNSGSVREKIKTMLNIEIDLISGDSEAELNYYAIEKHFKAGRGILVDMGGGSTEFLGFEGNLRKGISESFGSLHLYKKFVSNILPKKEELLKIEAFTAKRLQAVKWIKDYGGALYCIGGTARAVAKIDMCLNNRADNVNGYRLAKKDILYLYNEYKRDKKNFLSALIKEIPDRIHTFIPGLIFFHKLTDFLCTDNIIISSFGVREGYLIRELCKP